MIEERATDVRFKTYEAPFNADTFFWTEFTPREGFATATSIAAISADCATCRDTSTSRSSTCEPASRAASPCRRSRSRVVTRRSSRTWRRTRPIRCICRSATCRRRSRGRAGADACRSARDHRRPRSCRRITKLLDVHSQRNIWSKARTTLAASKLPDGAAYYQAMIRKFTTLDLTAAADSRDRPRRGGAHQGAGCRPRWPRTGFKGTLPEFMVYLRTDPQFYAKTPRRAACRRGLHRQEGGPQAQGNDRYLAALPSRHPAGAGRAGADLHRRTRRARELHVQHLQPAGASALHAAGAGAARVHARSQLPGGAGAGSTGPPGVPQRKLFLRLWRGLGPLHRMARRT